MSDIMRTFMKDKLSLKTIVQRQSTKSCDDVPLLYREPYILGEYRPPGRSWLYYLSSISHRHNETLNIWTHLIASMILIHKTINYLNTAENNCETMPLAAFGFCAVANSIFSALAHTFHSKSPFWHYVCFQLDYTGVGLYGFATCLLFLTTSCPNAVYDRIGQVSVPVYILLAWFVMLGGCASKLLFRRPYPLKRRLIQLTSGGFLGIFGNVPLISRFMYCIADTDCSIVSLSHHLLWITTAVISLATFSFPYPEKTYPGRFDFIGHSHQLFHVFMMLTYLLQFKAAQMDATYKQQTLWSCHFISLRDISCSVTVYAIGCIFIIFLLTKFVKKRVHRDEKTC